MTVSVMVASILASLIAAALAGSSRHIWSRHIWAQTGKGMLRGPWITEIVFPDGEQNTHRIRLWRLGRWVWGNAICEKGWGKGFQYKIRGTFRNLVLVATYKVGEKRRLERGSLTLMLVDGGSKLQGYLVYLDNEKNRIETTACEWLAEDVPSPK